MEPINPSPEDQMMKIILGKWISKPVHVAAELGLADILAQKEEDIETLAAKTETSRPVLHRMLRALAAVGIFAEKEPGVFSNTPLSESLRQGRLKAAALLFHSYWHDAAWDNLSYSVKTGEPAFEKVFDQPIFDWLATHPSEERIFNQASFHKAATTHGVIADGYDFSRVNTLIDVGGGTGGLIMEILKKNPQIQGIVAETRTTVEKLNRIIFQKGLENRLSAVACDFFEKIPQGGDAYLLSHVIHDWPDDKSIAILKNCRRAMEKEATLLVVEGMIAPGNDFSITKLLDLEVLLMGGGCERTRAEFEQLFNRAGFYLSQVIPTKEHIFILEGICR